MEFTYLIINTLVFTPVLILSFRKEVSYYKEFGVLGLTLLLGAIPFIVWDTVFTKLDVWGFNPKYVIGLKIFELPVEEILFFFTIPFSSIFIYEVISYYIPRFSFKKAREALILLAFLFFLLSIVNIPNIYTTFVSLVAFIVTLILLVTKCYSEGRVLLFLLISYIPFIIVNAFLTSIPVVQYNSQHIIGTRFIGIPVEDFIYSYSMLSIYLLIYTALKKYFRSFYL